MDGGKKTAIYKLHKSHKLNHGVAVSTCIDNDTHYGEAHLVI